MQHTYFDDRRSHRLFSKKTFKKKNGDRFKNRSSQRKKQRIRELQEEDCDDDIRSMLTEDYNDNDRDNDNDNDNDHFDRFSL